MSARVLRKFNLAVGSLAWAGGFVALIGAVYTAMHPSSPAPAPVAFQQVTDPASCRAVLDDLGYMTSTVNGEITARDIAYDATASTVSDQFVRASLAIEMCRLPLHDFCAGECDGVGSRNALKFSLDLPAPSAKGVKPTEPVAAGIKQGARPPIGGSIPLPKK